MSLSHRGSRIARAGARATAGAKEKRFALLKERLRRDGGEIWRSDPADGSLRYFLRFRHRKLIVHTLDAVELVMHFVGVRP